MVGLRGVGKTVLLERIREEAESNGIYTLQIEAPENRSFPSVMVPQLRLTLLKISNREAAKELAQRALRGLAGFVKTLKLEYQGIGLTLESVPEPGLADSGDLETDLQDLLEARRCGPPKRTKVAWRSSSTNFSMSKRMNLRRSSQHCIGHPSEDYP